MKLLSSRERRKLYDAWAAVKLPDAEAGEAEFEDHTKRVDALMERVAALPASSVQGLAAKAIAAANANSQIWERDARDLDWDERKTRELIEAVLSVAGIENPHLGHSPHIGAVDEMEIPPKPDEVLVGVVQLEELDELLTCQPAGMRLAISRGYPCMIAESAIVDMPPDDRDALILIERRGVGDIGNFSAVGGRSRRLRCAGHPRRASPCTSAQAWLRRSRTVTDPGAAGSIRRSCRRYGSQARTPHRA